MINARKAFNMFRETNLAVLGIVGDPRRLQVPACRANPSHIFGHDGARQWAEKSNTKFLGAIPLHMTIREHGDSGIPAVAAKDTEPHVVEAFTKLASEVAAQLSIRHMTMPQIGKLEFESVI